MPYPIDDATEHLKQSEKHFRLFLVIFTLIVGIFCAVQVVIVGRKVSQQSAFIINYLRCIGQVAPDQRGQSVTNYCFDKYAPPESNKGGDK